MTFKADKAGIVHTSIGNMKFSNADLTANLFAVMKAVNDARSQPPLLSLWLKCLNVQSRINFTFDSPLLHDAQAKGCEGTLCRKILHQI